MTETTNYPPGLLEAVKEASSALLIVYELAYDKMNHTERDALSRVRYVCAEILGGDR